MRFWFTPSRVGKVIIKKGFSHRAANLYSVYVCDREEKTLCGTYTPVHQKSHYSAAVECSGARGDSVKIELDYHINLFEIEIYPSVIVTPGKYTVPPPQLKNIFF